MAPQHVLDSAGIEMPLATYEVNLKLGTTLSGAAVPPQASSRPDHPCTAFTWVCRRPREARICPLRPAVPSAQSIPATEPIVNTEVAVRLNINGVTINILNSATKVTIENTLQSLRALC